MSKPLNVALTVELPQAIVDQLQAVSPRVRLYTNAELERDPEGYAAIEVAVVSAASDAARLRAARGLRWIQTVGAGVDRLLALNGVVRPDVLVTNASGIHAQPIAEHVFGFLLMFTRNLHLAAARQHQRWWDGSPYRDTLGTLRGKTLGILGLGAIGGRIAQIAATFGLQVIGSKRRPARVQGVSEVYGPEQLPQLLARTDFLVNILPLTEATRALLGRREFAQLPRGAFFLNVGRGATIDTNALVEALRSGQLAGAALDVTEPEPLPAAHELWTLPNVIITPHYAGAQPGYFQHAGELFVHNLRRYERGEPLLNVVDKEAGY